MPSLVVSKLEVPSFEILERGEGASIAIANNM